MLQPGGVAFISPTLGKFLRPQQVCCDRHVNHVTVLCVYYGDSSPTVKSFIAIYMSCCCLCIVIRMVSPGSCQFTTLINGLCFIVQQPRTEDSVVSGGDSEWTESVSSYLPHTIHACILYQCY